MFVLVREMLVQFLIMPLALERKRVVLKVGCFHSLNFRASELLSYLGCGFSGPPITRKNLSPVSQPPE